MTWVTFLGVLAGRDPSVRGARRGSSVLARIHFISGLPRSGSTLLAALLRQNPRFHADMSGPMAGLFGALLAR